MIFMPTECTLRSLVDDCSLVPIVWPLLRSLPLSLLSATRHDATVPIFAKLISVTLYKARSLYKAHSSTTAELAYASAALLPKKRNTSISYTCLQDAVLGSFHPAQVMLNPVTINKSYVVKTSYH